jgi:addiction module RelB/DinJ family antitoxin
MQEARINIRVSKNLKENAEQLFNHLGMNMSTAISVFLRKAVEEQEIPFIIGTKSLSYAGDLSSSQITQHFQKAVVSEISNKRENNVPVAKYDADNQKAYIEYPDGSREYINNEG